MNTEIKKTPIRDLKHYWFSNDWKDYNKTEFKKLVKAVNNDLSAGLEEKIDNAFAVKGKNDIKYMKRLDSVYDRVMFFYTYNKYSDGINALVTLKSAGK